MKIAAALRIYSVAAGSLLLAACAALKPPPAATPVLPDHAPAFTADAPAGGAWPGEQWWQNYADPVLDALIETAVGSGKDIATADARIRQADQAVRITAASLGVKVDATADYSFQRLSDNGLFSPDFLGYHWYDQANLGVSVRYQFDWWGKQQASLAASIDRSRALAAERQAAAMILAGSVAASYFGWQADTAHLTLQNEAIAVQQRMLANIERRIAAGLEPSDRAIEARQQLAMSREQLAVLEGSRQLHRVTLAALLGVDAGSLPALTARALPRATATLPDDLGTNLLARRADIRASRWRVEAALRDTDVERASFYPNVSLNALAGLSSIELGSLLNPDSATPRLGFAVDLPLFDSGMRHARHSAAMAGLEVAIATYEEAIVHAARDASLAATSLQQVAAQRQQIEARLEAAAALVGTARSRLDRQLSHEGPLLAARLTELNVRDALLRADRDALLADVRLRQALGGSLPSTETMP